MVRLPEDELAPLPYIYVAIPGLHHTVVQIRLHPDPRYSINLGNLSAWEREHLRLTLAAIFRQLGTANEDIEDHPWDD